MTTTWDNQRNALRQEWADSATAERIMALATAQRWLSNALVEVIVGNNEALEEQLSGY